MRYLSAVVFGWLYGINFAAKSSSFWGVEMFRRVPLGARLDKLSGGTKARDIVRGIDVSFEASCYFWMMSRPSVVFRFTSSRMSMVPWVVGTFTGTLVLGQQLQIRDSSIDNFGIIPEPTTSVVIISAANQIVISCVTINYADFCSSVSEAAKAFSKVFLKIFRVLLTNCKLDISSNGQGSQVS